MDTKTLIEPSVLPNEGARFSPVKALRAAKTNSEVTKVINNFMVQFQNETWKEMVLKSHQKNVDIFVNATVS